jgi:hypothetical protein
MDSKSRLESVESQSKKIEIEETQKQWQKRKKVEGRLVK